MDITTTQCTRCKTGTARGGGSSDTERLYIPMANLCEGCYALFQREQQARIAPGPVKYVGFSRENLPPNPSPEMLSLIHNSAAVLGARGGAATAGISTAAKRRAARRNGRLGGRPARQ